MKAVLRGITLSRLTEIYDALAKYEGQISKDIIEFLNDWDLEIEENVWGDDNDYVEYSIGAPSDEDVGIQGVQLSPNFGTIEELENWTAEHKELLGKALEGWTVSSFDSIQQFIDKYVIPNDKGAADIIKQLDAKVKPEPTTEVPYSYVNRSHAGHTDSSYHGSMSPYESKSQFQKPVDEHSMMGLINQVMKGRALKDIIPKKPIAEMTPEGTDQVIDPMEDKTNFEAGQVVLANTLWYSLPIDIEDAKQRSYVSGASGVGEGWEHDIVGNSNPNLMSDALDELEELTSAIEEYLMNLGLDQKLYDTEMGEINDMKTFLGGQYKKNFDYDSEANQWKADMMGYDTDTDGADPSEDEGKGPADYNTPVAQESVVQSILSGKPIRDVAIGIKEEDSSYIDRIKSIAKKEDSYFKIYNITTDKYNLYKTISNIEEETDEPDWLMFYPADTDKEEFLSHGSPMMVEFENISSSGEFTDELGNKNKIIL